jgi:hypothetical protein
MGSGSSKLPSNENSSFYKPPNSVLGVNVPEVPYTISSSPPGNKRAIVIGCNYLGTAFELSGCINDANTIENMLNNWGYSVTKMTDYSEGDLKPTWFNIINKLRSLIEITDENDSLIIYYSGHGSLISDTNGDEISGKDSTIVPLDVRTQGYIIDDKIREILVTANEGAKIFAVFDSCNSGSVCDLRCNLFDTSYRSEPFVKQVIGADPKLIPRYDKVINPNYLQTDAQIVSLSGCKDDQYSYEMVSDNGNSCGALTYSFVSCIKSMTPDIPFSVMLSRIKSTLVSLRMSQNPSLMCGRESFNPEGKLSDFLNI